MKLEWLPLRSYRMNILKYLSYSKPRRVTPVEVPHRDKIPCVDFTINGARTRGRSFQDQLNLFLLCWGNSRGKRLSVADASHTCKSKIATVMKDYARRHSADPPRTDTCLDLSLELDDPEILLAICLAIDKLLLMRCVTSGTASVRSMENDREVGSDSGSGSWREI